MMKTINPNTKTLPATNSTKNNGVCVNGVSVVSNMSDIEAPVGVVGVVVGVVTTGVG